MPDSRYRVRLADETFTGFAGLSYVGDLGKIYTPVALDNFANGTLCFCQSRKAALVEEMIGRPISNAALIIHEQLRGRIDEACLEKFSKMNIAIFAGEISPKGLFSLLLDQQGPADKGQLLLLTEKSPLGAFSTCTIEADCRIAATAQIGDGTIIATGVKIGDNARIGKNCIIAEGSMIYHDVELGDDVHIGPGSYIGSPVHANEPVGGSRKFIDIPQIGALFIGYDVRIGTQSVINRGTLSNTNLGDNIRIGDRVNVGHNVQIGNGVWIAAASIVCGSSNVGDNVSIGIGSVVKNKMKIGHGAMVGAGSVIISDVPAKNNTYPVPALSQKALLTLMRLLRKTAKR